MNDPGGRNEEARPSGLYDEVERDPRLLLRLAESALHVADGVREGYAAHTAAFVSDLRLAMRAAQEGRRAAPILSTYSIAGADWADLAGEVVTFIDGGVGSAEALGRAPLLVRVGSYTVRVGERDLSRRERFGYYPLILGDLEGGSKERDDFPQIVRLIAELLGGLAAMERTPDLGVLMFHGPLVYSMDTFAGHTPFTERDADIFLDRYAVDPRLGQHLKEDFLTEARDRIYPRLTPRHAAWSAARAFEPLSWMAFLYRRLVATARSRTPMPLVAGVVERGNTSREFSETVLLRRVFQGLRAKGNRDYFNRLYGRRDLVSPRALLDRLGYRDALLLALLLQPGQRTEAWTSRRYGGLRDVAMTLPGEVAVERINFLSLRADGIGFPLVRSCYVHVSSATEPIRVDVFDALGEEQLEGAAKRAYLYARLLPGYGFPVGLDVADKYAHVPAWLTAAYGKLIRYQLGVSLQKGEVHDAEMQRLLIQGLHVNRRDWLFRPHA